MSKTDDPAGGPAADPLGVENLKTFSPAGRGPWREVGDADWNDWRWQLKHRVGSATGHLSNQQAAALLKQLVTPRLRVVYLAHLSETNNTPALASAAATRALADGGHPDVPARLARQPGGSAAAGP